MRTFGIRIGRFERFAVLKLPWLAFVAKRVQIAHFFKNSLHNAPLRKYTSYRKN